MTEPAARVPEESVEEHVRNAMQLLHNLRSYEMSSAESLRYDRTLGAISARLQAALKKAGENRG